MHQDAAIASQPIEFTTNEIAWLKPGFRYERRVRSGAHMPVGGPSEQSEWKLLICKVRSRAGGVRRIGIGGRSCEQLDHRRPVTCFDLIESIRVRGIGEQGVGTEE